ncbi:hypothetical protein FHX81_7788 [Saccharothrix saharensis]|uniref:Tetratricopeptide repeat protein n=1 Tax=Saccharothrix saharensis TaxID=571190 RepID=A0A543JR42_9PSEU|nr:tetratricopeptide repeat protein [Saccharothrix saharensis]TQM85309.1 hypothetical protein FHX81_7788 [Saccharothrix saharensis]
MTGDRRDTPALPHLTPQLPDLSGLSFGGGGDLGEHFRRLEEITRRRADRAEPSTLFLPEFTTLAAEDSLDVGDDGEDLLEDARANITRGEYALALEQLAEFLDLSPGHAEARYLRGYCHYRLGDLMTALEITLPMRSERLDDRRVRSGVLELRATLRRMVTPEETDAFLDTRGRDPRGADERFRRFIALAPEEPEPPYLLAVMLVLDGDLAAAYRTAQAAVDEVEGDASRLRALADALQTAALGSLAGDAVRALADGAYSRARKALQRLDREWRETELVRDFDAYLGGLIRTGRSPAKPLPPPALSPERATRLYGLIADPYREEAVELVTDRRWAEAERVLAKVLHLVPAYPPPNYLYAICLLVQGKEPERAITAAGIAVRDPMLPEAELLLRRAVEAKAVLAINAAFDEHNAAMAAIGSPPTRQQLITLRRTMEGLRDRMPGLREQAGTGENERHVRKLADAVAQRLAEIDRATATIEVNELVSRFNRWAERSGPHPLYADLDFGQTELALIDRDVQRLLRSTTDPRARKVLQDLRDVLASVNRFG